MINEIRNAVLAIVNKNNYGYITPADFNLYAEQAQLSIFEDYFQSYNNQISRENARTLGTGYANLRQITEEVIDTFSMVQSLSQYAASTFSIPPDCYLMINVLANGKTAEKVSLNRINQLLASNLTAPSVIYPAYVVSGGLQGTTPPPQVLVQRITMYPTSIISGVTLQYIRYPRLPKWTWLNVGVNGDPVFNSSAADYIDFELPETDSPLLISKILQYAGISIREADVYKLGATDDTAEYQKDRS